MAVCRVNKTQNYTVMSNYHLKSKNLSLKAVGLLSKVLSLPDDWDYTVSGLVEICKENKTAITSALNELKQWGYLKVTKLMPNETESGRIEYIYDFFEHSDIDEYFGSGTKSSTEPNAKKPCKKTSIEKQDTEKQDIEKQGIENLCLENLDLDFQTLENQPQLNTNKSNTNKSNTKKSNTKGLNTNNFSIIHSTESIDSKVKPERMNEYEEICKRIDFEKLIRKDPKQAKLYLYIQAVLSFVLKNDKPIRVRGQEIPKSKAAEEYQKLNGDMIMAAAENFSKYQSKVKDMFAYIASSLYQLPQITELRKSGHAVKPISYDLEFHDEYSSAGVEGDLRKGILDQWLLNSGLSDLISEEEKKC